MGNSELESIEWVTADHGRQMVLTREQQRTVAASRAMKINNGGMPKTCHYTCVYGEDDTVFNYSGGTCNTDNDCTYTTPCSEHGVPWLVSQSCH